MQRSAARRLLHLKAQRMCEHTCMQMQRSSSHAAFKSNMHLQRSAAQRSVCVNAPLSSKYTQPPRKHEQMIKSYTSKIIET